MERSWCEKCQERTWWQQIDDSDGWVCSRCGAIEAVDDDGDEDECGPGGKS